MCASMGWGYCAIGADPYPVELIDFPADLDTVLSLDDTLQFTWYTRMQSGSDCVGCADDTCADGSEWAYWEIRIDRRDYTKTGYDHEMLSVIAYSSDLCDSLFTSPPMTFARATPDTTSQNTAHSVRVSIRAYDDQCDPLSPNETIYARTLIVYVRTPPGTPGDKFIARP